MKKRNLELHLCNFNNAFPAGKLRKLQLLYLTARQSQTAGFRIIQRSIHKIKEFRRVAGKNPESI